MNKYRVYVEPTAGPDIYEGSFDTFEEAKDYAMRYHFRWAKYWGKALYIEEHNTGKTTYIVRGKRK